jgi:hypothetical protein
MIRGTDIPLAPDEFVKNCLADARENRFAKPAEKYLDYLADLTEQKHPALFRFVKVFDREAGKERYNADADHIIPKSVWNILMPAELRGLPGQEFPAFSGTLSNLFWRDRQFNRRDDNLAIRVIKDATSTSMSKIQRADWNKKMISIFLV